MAVFASGESIGTVGGGPLEARALEAAKQAFADRRSALWSSSLADRPGADDAMLCGGRVQILVDFLDGSDATVLRIYGAVAGPGRAERFGWLARSVRPVVGDPLHVQTRIGLLVDGGRDFDPGSLDLSRDDLLRLTRACPPDRATLVTEGDVLYFLEPLAPPDRVVIVGAGHIGREVAILCDLLGLATVVVDDRPEYATRDRLPEATEIVISRPSFTDCLDGITVVERDRIIIATRGHDHDRSVLFQALKTPAGYVGMVGSRRKREVIYGRLLEAGVPPESLERVHCPVGLPIGARTPAEIAVSIASQFIALRNAKGATNGS